MVLWCISTIAILVAGLGGIVPGCLAASALAAVIGLVACRPTDTRQTRQLWFAGCIALCWLVATVLPLPASCAWVAGPQRQQFYAAVDSMHEHLATLAASPRAPDGAASPTRPPTPVARHLSLNVTGSLRYLLLVSGAWAAFWLTVAMPEASRLRYLKCLVAGGAGVAAVGIAGKYLAVLQACQPWQWLNEYGATAPVWPFVNRNHFATFTALLAPAALYLAIQPRPPQPHRTDATQDSTQTTSTGQATRRPRPPALWQHVLFLAAFTMLTLAGFLSLSRAGATALLFGVFASALCWLPGRRRTATAATFLVMGALAALVLLPTTELQQRLDTLRQATSDRSGTTRLHNWCDAAGMWQAFPIAGVGMDGFRTVFQLYRTTPSTTTTRFAENEYVQLLADGGLVAAALALALCLLYGRCLFERRTTCTIPARDTWGGCLARGPLRPVSPLYPAVLGAAVALAFHSSFDFSVRMPLNAFLAASMFGLAMPLPPNSLPRALPRRAAWVLPALLLLALVCLTGKASLNDDTQLDRDTVLRRADIPTLTRALELSPTYWCAWYELGRRLQARADANPGDGPSQTGALTCFAQAAACNPMDYRPWWTLGMLQLASGNRAAGTDSLARAVTLAPALDSEARELLAPPPSSLPKPAADQSPAP